MSWIKSDSKNIWERPGTSKSIGSKRIQLRTQTNKLKLNPDKDKAFLQASASMWISSCWKMNDSSIGWFQYGYGKYMFDISTHGIQTERRPSKPCNWIHTQHVAEKFAKFFVDTWLKSSRVRYFMCLNEHNTTWRSTVSSGQGQQRWMTYLWKMLSEV